MDWRTIWRHFVTGDVYARAGRSTGWAVAAAAGSRGIVFLSTVIAARILGATDFGELALIQSTVAVATTAAGLGLTVAVSKSLADNRASDARRAGNVVVAGLWVALLSGSVASILAWGLADHIASLLGAPSQFATLLRLADGAIALGAVGATQLAVLFGIESGVGVFVVTTLRSAITSVLLVLGSSLTGIRGAVVALSVGELIAVGLAQPVLVGATRRLGIRLRARVAAREIEDLWRVGAPALAATLAVQAGLWLGYASLSSADDGLRQLGYFGLAYRWHLLVLFAPAAVAPMAMPLLSHVRRSGQAEVHRSLFEANLRLSLAVVALGAVAIGSLASALMSAGGPEYGAAWPTLVILAVAALPSAANNVLGQAALSLDLVREWAASDVVLAVVFVAAARVLVDSSGAAGLATAYLFAMLASVGWLARPVYVKIYRPVS